MTIQAVLFAWLYPRLFSTRPEDWAGSAARFWVFFAPLAWSFAVLPVAAKSRTAAVADFLFLEKTFTGLHFAIVAPLIALARRGAGFGPRGRAATRSTASTAAATAGRARRRGRGGRRC